MMSYIHDFDWDRSHHIISVIAGRSRMFFCGHMSNRFCIQRWLLEEGLLWRKFGSRAWAGSALRIPSEIRWS
jgi:hypothetical protein